MNKSTYKFTAEWDNNSYSWIIYDMKGFSRISIRKKELGNNNNWFLDVIG